MNWLKSLIKRIVPITIHIFDKHIKKTNKKIDKMANSLSATIIKESESIKTQNKIQNQEYKKLTEAEYHALMKKLNHLEQMIIKMDNKISFTKESLQTEMREQLSPELYPQAISQWYTDFTGNILNLNNPQSYNEKIQWLKLNDFDPLRSELSDKLKVREWVEKKIGKKYLIPLLAVYKKADQIDFDSLPDRFVLKANHGSGMNIIVRDKNTINRGEIVKKADRWLKTNFAFHFGYELQYMSIPRCLVVEEYEENVDGDLPDYKFWCFDGKVAFIEVIANRNIGAHMAIYDKDWNILPFTTGAYPPFETDIPRPSELSEMIEIAQKLSEGFLHVRVDLYIAGEKGIKFGEMTFTSGSGTARWDPPEVDYEVGKLLHLPIERN